MFPMHYVNQEKKKKNRRQQKKGHTQFLGSMCVHVDY